MSTRNPYVYFQHNLDKRVILFYLQQKLVLLQVPQPKPCSAQAFANVLRLSQTAPCSSTAADVF